MSVTDEATAERRGALGWLSNIAMAVGLTGAYGTLTWFAGRFLYPSRPDPRTWVFVSELDALDEGDSRLFRTPGGETVNVTRRARRGDAGDFIALSSVCPHLGCQVHWESRNERYFCPCHNGIFDPEGRGIGGPPGDAGQSLSSYRLRVDRGMLFMEVPEVSLARAGAAAGCAVEVVGHRGAGHDPCLATIRDRGEAAS